MNTDSIHWDKRARLGVVYKKENFYTITPVPFYFKRRKILLSLMTQLILQSKKILDFGCGDGWYLNYFKNKTSGGKDLLGMDISRNMILLAQEKYPDMKFENTSYEDLVNYKLNFDLIYIFAVLAHVNDNIVLDKMIKIMSESIMPGGKLVIFEQVAPESYSGTTFIRRTIDDYEQLFVKNGFKLTEKVLISFNFHRFFERHIAKNIYKYFVRGNNEEEKRVNANKHFFFRFLSRSFIFFDIKPLKTNPASGWGNVFMVFEK